LDIRGGGIGWRVGFWVLDVDVDAVSGAGAGIGVGTYAGGCRQPL